MEQEILAWLETVINSADSFRKQLASGQTNGIEVHQMLGRVMGKAMDLRTKLRGK